MRQQVNQFGLGRNIPEAVKREVRQRCGFGCVVCGSAFYQYEHLNPPFADARQHNADGIVLLCGGCHDRKTRRLLSSATVRKHAEDPTARQTGFSFGPLDIGDRPPLIQLGEVLCLRVQHLLVIDRAVLFTIRPPEVPGGPFRIWAHIAGPTGACVLKIVDNEVRPFTSNWDVQVVGPVITVRSGPRNVVLQLRIGALNSIAVERLEMMWGVGLIRIRAGEPTVIRSMTGRQFGLRDTQVVGAEAALLIEQDGVAVGYRAAMVKFSHEGPAYEVPTS